MCNKHEPELKQRIGDALYIAADLIESEIEPNNENQGPRYQKVLSFVAGATGYMAVGALTEPTENKMIGAAVGLGKYTLNKLTKNVRRCISPDPR